MIRFGTYIPGEMGIEHENSWVSYRPARHRTRSGSHHLPRGGVALVTWVDPAKHEFGPIGVTPASSCARTRPYLAAARHLAVRGRHWAGALARGILGEGGA